MQQTEQGLKKTILLLLPKKNIVGEFEKGRPKISSQDQRCLATPFLSEFKKS